MNTSLQDLIKQNNKHNSKFNRNKKRFNKNTKEKDFDSWGHDGFTAENPDFNQDQEMMIDEPVEGGRSDSAGGWLVAISNLHWNVCGTWRYLTLLGLKNITSS